MKTLLYPAIIGLSLGVSGIALASNQDLNEQNSDESQRVKDQKQAGILEEDRDYNKKSDFVKNRDRAEGVAQQTGEALKEAGKDIGDTVKKLF